MRILQTFAVIALTLCLIQSTHALTLGSDVSGVGWRPGGFEPGSPWTENEQELAQQDAIDNANEVLDLHVELELMAFPRQVYADHMILEDHMGFYPDDPKPFYRYSVVSYVIIFESGHFEVIYP